MRSFVWIALCLIAGFGTRGFAAEEGLVGHWRFDAGPGPVQDLSGKGHTATLTGGEVVDDNGRKVLRMDGQTRIEVPSSPDFNVVGGAFSIEARIKPSDLSNGRLIVFKEDEYLLRIDWPVETSRLSFFLKGEKGWEPRASSYKLPPDRWVHIAAVWNGSISYVWVNGQPFHVSRHGDAPKPTEKPLLIGSQGGFGAGFVGCMDYVRIYRRALTSGEIIRRALGIGETPGQQPDPATAFDFARGALGWAAREGASSSPDAGGLTYRASEPGTLLMHDHLNAGIDRKDYLSVRMAVDHGSRAEVIFVTTKGAGRIPFQVYDDNAWHTYVLEPWQWPGWSGNLLALGLAPTEAEGATARVRTLQLSEQVQAEPELQVMSILTESALPRAGRPEQVTVRLRNAAGPAPQVKVTLRAPKGVAIQGPAVRSLPALGYLEEKELTWPIRASAPGRLAFTVATTVAGKPGPSLNAGLAFQPKLSLARASYVPEPKPISTGKYRLWAHYCPLWKHGTHMGWGKIEAYPERKPVIGWYNEGTPEVADWHIKYWLEHGISGVVYCWYRSDFSPEIHQSLGHAIHDGLLKAKYLSRIQWSIMWENGCGKGANSLDDLVQNVFPYWLKNYFTHPSYLKIDGKPVLYIWVPGNMTRDMGGSENVRKAFDLMRRKCRERGLAGLYIVGCVGGPEKPTLERMAREGWDASSAYGNGWVPPAKLRTVGKFQCAPYEGFIDQQESYWKAKREWNLLPDITAAMMGWDSRPWNETPFFWSENTPAKFRELCLRAKRVMDSSTTRGPESNTAIFCCWNEFGEGHYIEPTRGYGFSYLDAIRDVFGQGPKAHTDLAPEDVGLRPKDSWYRQARAAAKPGGATSETSWSGKALAAWGGTMGFGECGVKEGVLRAVSNSPDSAFGSPALKVRAGHFSKVVIEMRVSRPGGAQLFWTTTSYPGASEFASATVETVADGQFHPLVFNVGANDLWGGCLTGLRFDPAVAPGVTVEVKSIRLE